MRELLRELLFMIFLLELFDLSLFMMGNSVTILIKLTYIWDHTVDIHLDLTFEPPICVQQPCHCFYCRFFTSLSFFVFV